MAFNPLRAFWRRRIARAVVGVLVLAVAGFAQYRLAKVPMPVQVETTEPFSPATIRLGQEELVIEEPVASSAQRILFSHDGMPNETVDVIFDRARLEQKTIGLFEMLGQKPPSTPARIDYRVQESKSAAGHEPCRTRVELLAASRMPAEIHLFQLGDPGQNYYRYLEMSTTGAELVSNLQSMSPDDSELAPGCQYLLGVGDWNLPINRTGVTTVVAENSALRFYFRQLTADAPPPWADTEGFLPLDLGAPPMGPSDAPFLQARAVSIRPLGGSNSASAPTALASARSTNDGPPLTISRLRIGSDQLQLSIAGTGWVQVNGEYASVNLLNRVQENPIPAALLAAVNAALLAWVARLVFKRPSTSPQAGRAKRQSRKSQRKPKGGAKK